MLIVLQDINTKDAHNILNHVDKVVEVLSRNCNPDDFKIQDILAHYNGDGTYGFAIRTMDFVGTYIVPARSMGIDKT